MGWQQESRGKRHDGSMRTVQFSNIWFKVTGRPQRACISSNDRSLHNIPHTTTLPQVMTKEPYVVNNLLLFPVLSYDLTVDKEVMIAWGWFTTATWWRWIEVQDLKKINKKKSNGTAQSESCASLIVFYC